MKQDKKHLRLTEPLLLLHLKDNNIRPVCKARVTRGELLPGKVMKGISLVNRCVLDKSILTQCHV